LSRTQQVIFTPLDKKMIFNKLKSIYFEKDEKELRIASSLSQGSITAAINFIKYDFSSKRKNFLDSLISKNNMKFASVIKLVAIVVKTYAKDDFYIISTLLEFLKTIMRDAIIVKLNLNNNLLLNKDYLKEIEKFSKLPQKVLINEIEKITKLQSKIKSNVNTKVILESYFISFLRETS
jgi:hypothetical protein